MRKEIWFSLRMLFTPKLNLIQMYELIYIKSAFITIIKLQCKIKQYFTNYKQLNLTLLTNFKNIIITLSKYCVIE